MQTQTQIQTQNTLELQAIFNNTLPLQINNQKTLKQTSKKTLLKLTPNIENEKPILLNSIIDSHDTHKNTANEHPKQHTKDEPKKTEEKKNSKKLRQLMMFELQAQKHEYTEKLHKEGYFEILCMSYDQRVKKFGKEKMLAKTNADLRCALDVEKSSYIQFLSEGKILQTPTHRFYRKARYLKKYYRYDENGQKRQVSIEHKNQDGVVEIEEICYVIYAQTRNLEERHQNKNRYTWINV